jgi:hypothetical protein
LIKNSEDLNEGWTPQPSGQGESFYQNFTAASLSFNKKKA